MWLLQNYLRYRRELRRQEAAFIALEKTFPPQDPNDLDSSWMAEYVRQEDELLQWKWLIQTEYLTSKADRLDAQMPDISDPDMYRQVEWDSDPKQPRYLTEKGIRAARTAIREEQKHRRDSIGYWFGIVVGLIGALTGLVSVFKA